MEQQIKIRVDITIRCPHCNSTNIDEPFGLTPVKRDGNRPYDDCTCRDCHGTFRHYSLPFELRKT